MTPDQAFDQLAREFKTVMTRLPLIVGNEAVNVTLDNFKRQGFVMNIAAIDLWKPVKKSWVNKNKKGTILVQTGNLRRATRIVRMTQDSVTIGNNMPYAKAHNEGLKIGLIQTVKPYQRKDGTAVTKSFTRRINQNIPKRQFMGNSPYMEFRLKTVTANEFIKEIKTLTL